MRKNQKQNMLFRKEDDWKKLWQNMPEFNQPDIRALQSIIVHFATREDRNKFQNLINQTLTDKTKSIWFPPAQILKARDKQWITKDSKIATPIYPIYVISKGRWESRMTVRALERMHIAYKVVIEPQEYSQYASVINPKNILKLPFSNLGLGSIPARNWVWEHSIEQGAKRHWILDDNIDGFFRLHNNIKIPVGDGSCFRIIEDFVERFTNVGLAGMHYTFFAPGKAKLPPFYLNTRIYSNILIRNDLPFRWRGKYNEDTDLSLRVLKSNICTILFNAFLANKMPTMTMKGGNTDKLYQEDGRLNMAKSLQEQHPDLVKIHFHWGRWQHLVNYDPFKSLSLIPDPKAKPMKSSENDFGFFLKDEYWKKEEVENKKRKEKHESTR